MKTFHKYTARSSTFRQTFALIQQN